MSDVSPAIRNRVRRLALCDRLLLLLVGCWTIVGIPINYLRVHGPVGLVGQFSLPLAMVIWASIAGVVAYSVIRQQRKAAAYGFTLKSGGVASLAIAAVIHVYFVMSGKLVLAASENLVWIALGAFMEELAFRVIAIDNFIRLLDGIRAKAFWAILASSVLFSIPHIPSKTPLQLQGIFLSSLLVGYIYYKSKSILLPAWYHGISNAGSAGGILIVALYCLITLAGCTLRPRDKQITAVAGASRGT